MVDTSGGTPRLALDIGGVTRYATYMAGSGTSSLIFSYTPLAGDLDLNGITLNSPLDFNGGSIADLGGNIMSALSFTPPVTTGVRVDYPSLSANFLTNSYSVNGTMQSSLSGFLAANGGSFSRNLPATYYDSSGVLNEVPSNSPRFDHDPVTHSARGLLMEPSRTNRARNSYFSLWSGAQPDNISNPGNNITKVAGEFGSNAMRITGPVANGGSRVHTNNLGTVSASTTITTTVRVRYISGSGSLCLAVDAWSATAFCYPSASMSSGQWVTLSQTATSPGSSVTGSSGFHTNNSTLTVDIDWWQFEAGNFATSYIPTTTANVTRPADVLTIPISGSWFNPTQGSFALEGNLRVGNPSGFPGFASFDDGTANNAMHILIDDVSSDMKTISFYTGSIAEFSYQSGSYINESVHKAAFAYELNNSIAAQDGSLGSVDTSVTIPSVTTLRLGARRGGADTMTGHLRSMRYYPSRVSNADVRALTQ